MYKHLILSNRDQKRIDDVLFGCPETCVECGRTAIQVYQMAGIKRAVCDRHITLDSVEVIDPEMDLI